MKLFFILLFSLSAFADISLDEAYRREKTYLLAQKEALVKMKTSLLMSFRERKKKAEVDLSSKQSELASLSLKNQELQEEFKALDKVVRDSSQMSGQLEKNALKIQENLVSLKAKLGLKHDPQTELDPVRKFEMTLDDVYQLIETISTEKWREHAFLDENENLVKGEVLFLGLFSAWGKYQGKTFNLMPYNNEFLKVLTKVDSSEIYLFSPQFERSGLKTNRTWKESVADALPGVVMAIIMMAVLGLFILLARA